VEDKNFVVNLVSKSGRTLEIITAFSIFKNLLDKKYGEESHKHIFITSTENNEGLHKLAIKNNNIFFNIPELIGGRYSIITPASLFPFAMNGMDIENIIKGFLDAKDYYKTNDDCLKFAITRNYLYNKGKRIDLFITYNEKMRYFSEWYKQLFGESQGKDNTGLFPSSAMYSTDLHSIGQYIQEGYKSIIENTLYIRNNNDDISIDLCDEFADEFGFVNGKTLNQISESCLYGTIKAHKETPNILVTVPHVDEYVFGWLIYFYEEACILGSILMGVNPFNQYGVEKYKKEMINKLTL
jgi:glucose-6-phosphate isomerase